MVALARRRDDVGIHCQRLRKQRRTETDTDGDGIRDSRDTDDDNDGVADNVDAFPLDASESVDTDNDGIGNNADTDDDGDMVADADDAFPLDASESVDTDMDGVGNNADTDDDGDMVADADDAFPLDASESVDTDMDGVGNNADTDDDNDMVADVDDAFPLDATESVDTDMDGIGNNADTDDDNDMVADADDDFPLNPARTGPIQPLFPEVGGLVQLPDWPSTRQLNWVLEQLAAPSTSIADIEAHFLPSTLAVTPAADWQTFFDGLRAVAPNGQIVDLLIANPIQIQALIGDASDPTSLGLFLTITTRVDNGGLIISLGNFNLALDASSVSPLNQGQTLTEAADRFAELTENSSLLVAEIDENNVCVPILDNDASVPRPLGLGMQNLWLVGAVAQAVDDGLISGSQQVMLDINNISTLGTLGFEPPGTVLTLPDLTSVALTAEPTATDQLFDLVGRDAIEAALGAFGHQNTDLIMPFLKAAHYYNLVFRIDEATALTFPSATEADQRTFVDGTLAPLGPYNLTVAPPFRNAAVHVSGLMQASAMDICGAIARFRQFNDQSDAFSILDQAYGARSGGLKVRDRWERVWSNIGVTRAPDAPINSVASYAFMVETDGRGAFVLIALASNGDNNVTNVPVVPAFSPLNRILEIIDETN